MSELNDLEDVLDDCLQRMMSGRSSLSDCLKRYPEWAAELKPMLEASLRLGRGRRLTAPPRFKTRAKKRLTDYWQAHPRSGPGLSPWVLRAVTGLAVVLVIILLAGTAYAQNALPGQPLYGWKVASEKAWRAVAPDPVSVDLSIADRRADELTTVVGQQGQPGREAEALQNYQDSILQLQTDANPSDNGQIMRALESHQRKFTAAGIDDPKLDAIIHGKP